MDNQLVVAITGDDGQTSYVPISEVENSAEIISSLPDELIQGHPEWQRVDTVRNNILEESRGFKTRAQEAEAKLKEKSGHAQQPSGDEAGTGNTSNNQTTDTPTLPDEETMYNNFRKRFLQEQEQERSARKAEDTAIAELVKKHGLMGYDDIVDTLRLAAPDSREALAIQLGRNAKQFGLSDSGETEVDTVDSVMEKVNKNLFG